MRRKFITDDILIDQLTLNDTIAFEELCHRYSYSLFSYCNCKLHAEDDSKRIVRDIFISLWEKRNSLPIGFSISAYLYGEVRKSVIKCIHTKLEPTFESSIAKENIRVNFSVAQLQKARQPVITNTHQYPESFTFSFQNRTKATQWLADFSETLQLSFLKNRLQKALNVFL